MKIKNVILDKASNSVQIEANSIMSFPLNKLSKDFSHWNNIEKIYIDHELGSEAITLININGDEESIHIDNFLEQSSDPDFFRNLLLYNLTVELGNIVERENTIKSHISKVLCTSTTQIYRILDTKNYTKTIDQVIKFLAALGYGIDFKIVKLNKETSIKESYLPFDFIDDASPERESAEKFNGLKLVG